MKKKNILSLLFLIVIILFTSCDGFLNAPMESGLKPEEATEPEGFVTAAYAALSNNRGAAMWAWGDVRSDDAYKGGGGITDGFTEHCYEISKDIRVDFNEPDGFWFTMYIGISRANAAINVLKTQNENDFPLKNTRIAEMRFLRAHFYFNLKVMFKHIPYIDDTVSIEDYGKVSNVEYSNDELWQKIADDFEFAYHNLPAVQKNANGSIEVGRVNKYSAAAYLAKTMLYKAYHQNEQHEVISIDAADLEKVLTYTEDVLNSPYHLESDFGYNFMPGNFENGPESLFAIQFTIDDGTMYGRLNYADFLSVPQGLGCCDFHKPSQDLVNAFKTSKGLPMYNNYNLSNYNKEFNSADPRLFHTVAIPDLPYKYNENRLYQESWNRYKELYGVFASLKENVDPDCDCFVNLSPYYANSKNKIIIRYADVLLWRAEALIELNREKEALPLINELRQRAKNSIHGLVDYSDDIKPKMEVELYSDDANWTKEYARRALRWERRLEFAMENTRFFDLVRWGIADDVINSYYNSEKRRRSYYEDAEFQKNKNEYMPIPQQQIGFSKYLYEQNYGWN